VLGALGSVLVAIVILAIVARKDKRLGQLAGAALAMHVLFAFGQYWVQEIYYGVSDVHMYAEFAEPIERALEIDFFRFAPEVLKLIIHSRADLPVPIGHDGGDPATTMIGITALLFFVVGTSTIASFVTVAMLTWIGALLLAKAFLDDGRTEQERDVILVGTMLVPSVVFWSSAIVKEAFVMFGLGLMCYAIQRVFRHRRIWLAPFIVIGGVTIGTLKPYVLFPFVLAFAAWVFVARTTASGRTVRIPVGAFVIAALLAVGGILLMGTIFPQFSVDKIGEQAAHQQEIWERDTGSPNSNVDIGPVGGGSIAAQLPYVPLALVNSLFRPFVFEARNITMFAAALETAALTYVFATLVWRHRFRAIRDAILKSPLVSASLVFVLVFAVAVGLTTLNLGTLSRYRLPMMPFYVVAVGLLRSRLTAASRAQVLEREPSSS
jgi:hypothetical protein